MILLRPVPIQPTSSPTQTAMVHLPYPHTPSPSPNSVSVVLTTLPELERKENETSSMTLGSDLASHAQRLWKWRLDQVQPTNRESNHLDRTHNGSHPVLRSFLVWRHTNLLVAWPITMFGALWDIVLLSQALKPEVTESYNGLGKFLLVLPFLASLCLFLTVAFSTAWWSNWRRTRLIIKTGWAVSFALPFVPAIFPLESLLTDQLLSQFMQSGQMQALLMQYKSSLALNYVFAILPLVITFPGGAVRAAVRIRGLLPQ